MRKYFVGLTIFCWLLPACNGDRQVQHMNSLLTEQAALLVENRPDSALVLLDSVNTALMDEGQYAGFLLLRTRARHAAGWDISTDTAVYHAKRYFTLQGDNEKAAWANYYLGRIYLERKEYGKALPAFNEAAQQTKASAGNSYLEGLIHYYLGKLYYDNDKSEEAVACYRRASAYFHEAGKTANEILSVTAVGNAYLLCNQADSALQCYYRAISQAIALNDTSVKIGTLMQNAGVALMNSNDPAGAKEMYFRAIGQENSREEQARIYLNMAAACLHLNQNDSTMYYGKKARMLLEYVKTKETMAYAYNLFAGMEEATGNYKAALENTRESNLYVDEIYASTLEQATAIAQKSGDGGLAYDTKGRERMAAQDTRIVRMNLAMTIIIGAIIAGMLGFLAWRLLEAQRTIKILRKNEKDFASDLAQLNAKLKNAGNESEKQAVIEQIITREDSLYCCFQPILESRRHAMKRERRQQLLPGTTGTADDASSNANKKKSEWESFEKLLPKILLERLRQKYGLQDTNLQVCSLLYFSLRNIDIAEILGRTSGSLDVTITRIRKTMNLEAKGDVGQFLRHNLWVTPQDTKP